MNKIDEAGDKKNPTQIDQALAKNPDAIKDLGKIASQVLAKEPENIKATAKETQEKLGDREKQLENLAKQADALAKKIDQTPNPTPEQLKELNDLQNDAAKEVSRALNDVAVDKSPFLFQGAQPADLRSKLNDNLDSIKSAKPDTEKGQPQKQELADLAKKLADQLKDAKDSLNDYKKDLPSQADKKSEQVADLVKNFPEAAK